MNNLTTLEAYVTAHPDERTPVRALVDAHEEILDVPHKVAVRAVARIHRAARQARDLAEAAHHLADGSIIKARLVSMLVMASEADPSEPVSVYLIPGRRPPRAVVKVYTGEVGQFEYWHLTVGALFILALVKCLMSTDGDPQLPAWMFEFESPTV